MIPGWILDIFAAVMLAVAAVSAARLLAARPWRRDSVVTDTDIAHLLMAIAMAGMLVSSLATMPDAVWEVIFSVLTAWFAFRVILDARVSGARALAAGHCAPHLVHSGAMLYMFLAIAAPAGPGQGMTGMTGSSAVRSLGVPTLGLVFALILAGYTVWDLDQLSGQARTGPAGRRIRFSAVALAGLPATQAVPPAGPPAAAIGVTDARAILLSPGMTVACRIAMGATMAFMLLIMI